MPEIATKIKYFGVGTLVPFYGAKVPALSIYCLVVISVLFLRTLSKVLTN